MDTKIKDSLSYWDQAGERPYELLEEVGLLDTLISHISNEKFILEDPIYRGTIRHNNLMIGDIFKYTYPTSWTYEEDIAQRFIEDSNIRVIFKLISINNDYINAMENDENTYDEAEVIVNPITMKVIKRKIKDSIIYLTVIKC